MRVVIGTGGTAGHIFPALALADHLREVVGAEVRFVGRSKGQEAAMVPLEGFPFDTVEALPFRRGVLDRQPSALPSSRSGRRTRPGRWSGGRDAWWPWAGT